MVRLQVLTGMLAGAPWEVPVGLDPVPLFIFYIKEGWEWKLDVTAATSDEKKIWLRADMGARIIRALMQTRPVFYNGRVYICDGSQLEVFKVGQRLEDQITADNLMVVIVADNDDGVVVEVAN